MNWSPFVLLFLQALLLFAGFLGFCFCPRIVLLELFLKVLVCKFWESCWVALVAIAAAAVVVVRVFFVSVSAREAFKSFGCNNASVCTTIS